MKMIPSNLPALPENYVYLGRGGEFKTLDRGFIGISCPYDGHYWSVKGVCLGTYYDYHYAALSDSEIVKINKMTLEEQVSFARTLVGKTIKSQTWDDVFGTVEKIEISFKKARDCYSASVGSLWETHDEALQLQGFVVVLRGTWNNGHPMCQVVGGEHIVVDDWETVTVNGYKAEKTSTGYKFGCAEISKELLTKAKELLELSHKDSSNKEIESIMIGAGEFNLEILKKLV